MATTAVAGVVATEMNETKRKESKNYVATGCADIYHLRQTRETQTEIERVREREGDSREAGRDG